jgi:hypothetical protein
MSIINAGPDYVDATLDNAAKLVAAMQKKGFDGTAIANIMVAALTLMDVPLTSITIAYESFHGATTSRDPSLPKHVPDKDSN